jgi:hypothetical protein
MFRKKGTTFAGSFAAANAARKEKARPMIEELEDRNLLSASNGATRPDDRRTEAIPPAVSAELSAIAKRASSG